MAVGFFPRPHEFQLQIAGFHLRRPEILEDGKISATPDLLGHSFGQLDTAANRYHVYILGWAVQENIPHISAYYIYLNT